MEAARLECHGHALVPLADYQCVCCLGAAISAGAYGLAGFSQKRMKLTVLVVVALLAIRVVAQAQEIDMTGAISYNQIGSTVNLQVQRIDNLRASGSYSGTLMLQLWATSMTYTGYPLFGYKMAEANLGRLYGQYYLSFVNRTVSYLAPPNGTHNIVLVLTEWNGFSYQPIDWYNFGFVTVGLSLLLLDPAPTPAPPPVVDRSPPRLNITTPSRPTVATRANRFRLVGRAVDNVTPTHVQIRIRAPGRGYGNWATVSLSGGSAKTKNWSRIVTVNRKGNWSIQIRALDARKNASAIRTVSIIRR